MKWIALLLFLLPAAAAAQEAPAGSRGVVVERPAFDPLFLGYESEPGMEFGGRTGLAPERGEPRPRRSVPGRAPPGGGSGLGVPPRGGPAPRPARGGRTRRPGARVRPLAQLQLQL